MSADQDWPQLKAMVLSKLKGSEKKIAELEDNQHINQMEILNSINAVKVEIATLKASSGRWGGASGGIVAIIISLLYYLLTGEKAV